MATEKKSVCVVVVGDIGRSPRMQYHALSLAKEGFDVDIVGYAGSEPLPELREHRNVHFIFMSPCPDIRSGRYSLLIFTLSNYLNVYKAYMLLYCCYSRLINCCFLPLQLCFYPSKCCGSSVPFLLPCFQSLSLTMSSCKILQQYQRCLCAGFIVFV